MQPETRYAKSGDVHIAYQVTGGGPIDLVMVPGFVSHLEADWESPARARQLERLGSFCRLIRFDKRGTGLSDRGPIPSLEQRMDDVRAVMDATRVQTAALFGNSEGGPMSMLFAATYPQRVRSLIMYGTYARRAWAPDFPHGKSAAEWTRFLQRLEEEWGRSSLADIFAPGMTDNQKFLEGFAAYLRLSASPGAAIDIMRMNGEIDVRPVLPAIRVPTLILHRQGDKLVYVEQARELARQIPNSILRELPGADHLWTVGDTDGLIGEIEEFLTGVRHGTATDTVLATVLFLDIVGSTAQAVTLGDRRWRDLLAQHQADVRRRLKEFRGREIDTAGDGFFASFDGPARAVRCAGAVMVDARGAGLQLRAGVHTGECEVLDDKLSGIAVHIGARIASAADPGQVLVSGTVRDLIAGSGLDFTDLGARKLKGVPGEWRLHAAQL